ncbi:MAG: thiamine-phosphate kinase [Terracidiphilus sp.]
MPAGYNLPYPKETKEETEEAMKANRRDRRTNRSVSTAGGRSRALPSDERAGGELSLLSLIRSRAGQGPGRNVRVGIGDDCSILGVRASEELAVTTDLSIAGRHFRLDWHPAESIGHRALARGLSDLAAMGAGPVAAFLSLGLPRELTRARGREPSWISRFYDGLLALADAYETPLAGGDLAESPVAVADIVLVGAMPRGNALLRSGARPGDSLYVTGSLGGAAAGLARLAALAAGAGPPAKPASQPKSRLKWLRIPGDLQPELAPHLYPQPRISQGLWLQRRGLATAAIDLSDGLSTDLAHLCAESGVAAEVDSALLPVWAGASREQALHGGEDYELLFTAPPSARLPKSIAGVSVTCIGRISRRRKDRPSITLVDTQGRPPRKQPLEPKGWKHFS